MPRGVHVLCDDKLTEFYHRGILSNKKNTSNGYFNPSPYLAYRKISVRRCGIIFNNKNKTLLQKLIAL